MRSALKYAMAVTTVVGVTSVAQADIRLVHKSGTASGTSCGQNNNTGDATNGPCNTIGGAYAASVATGTGGINIVIISNGGFNENLNFNSPGRNVTIKVSNNGFANLSPTSGTSAITVNLGNNDSVRIYDLWISGPPAVANGISFVTGGRLELHNMSIRGFATTGVLFAPNTSAFADLLVVDSDIAETSGGCIMIKPTGTTTATANIKNSQIHHCSTFGVRTDATASSTFVRTLIANSIVSNSGNSTIVSVTTGAGTARTLVENSEVLNASNGVTSNGANAQIVLNAATLMGHNTAVFNPNGGQVFSYGNSIINFNAANGTTPTVLALK
jgi:hypothetical protein